MKQDLQHRISAFVQLGKAFRLLATDAEWTGFESGLTEEEYNGFKVIIESHFQTNGWFTPQNVKNALEAWGNLIYSRSWCAYVKPEN